MVVVCSSSILLVLFFPVLEFGDNELAELAGSLNDLADDLATSGVLAFHKVVLDFRPLVLSATSHKVLLHTKLRLDLLDKLSDKLTNDISALITRSEKLNGRAKLHIFEGLKTVILKDALLIGFETGNEVLLLLSELFLETKRELGLDLTSNLSEDLSLLSVHLIVHALDLSEELTARALKRVLEGHLNVEKVTFERVNLLKKSCLVGHVVDLLAALLHDFSLTDDLSVEMLLLLLVAFDFDDGLSFGISLSLLHLVLAEGNVLLLVDVLVLDQILELSDISIDLSIGLSKHFLILEESSDLRIVLKSLAALLEDLLCLLNVGFFESFLVFFDLSVVLLIIVFQLSGLEFGLKVGIGLLTLFGFD